MADKKKTANPSRSASRSQMVSPKTASRAKEPVQESKAVSGEKEAAKAEKTVSRAKEPVQESRAVSRERERNKAAASKAAPKAPAFWQRLRKYRAVRFFLDAYYELTHKVTWPTVIEARNMTIIVILLSAAVGLVLGMVDLGLYQVFLLISKIP